MGMLDLEIRYIAKSDDRLAVSKVYEESWKYAYKGIVPNDYLDHIPEGQWASRIELADRKNLVMVKDGIIIGTSGFGKSRMAEMNGFWRNYFPLFFAGIYGDGVWQITVADGCRGIEENGI